MSGISAASTRPVSEVMRSGVVLVDADLTVRAVARAMRDHDVRSVLAIDLSAETVGLVDEADLLKAWSRADVATAAQVMDPDPLVVDPTDPVGDVARRMLERRVSRALVANTAPSEESGRWSEWKERGLPVGLLTIADLLARADELESLVRAATPKAPSVARRAAPWIAFASVAGAILLLAVLVFFFLTSHPTVHPGCAVPTQGGC